MTRILGLSLLISFIAHTAYSQHYYNDLIMSGEIAKKRAVYQTNKVRSVKMISYDGTNQPIEGFGSSQAIAGNYASIVTETFTSLSGKDRITHSFNDKGLLTQSVDTTDGNKVIVQYTYDANSRISSITNMSFSPGGYSTREQHLWFYTAAGKPEKMLKIKNTYDTTVVTFKLDDKENVGEEKSVRAGTELPMVYYYYDDKNNLSDIVRYNNRAKRLLPDYIFEYDQAGRVSMMLVTTAGGADYQKWYYKYDEKGLKQKDECYGKNKMLIGKIEYSYKF